MSYRPERKRRSQSLRKRCVKSARAGAPAYRLLASSSSANISSALANRAVPPPHHLLRLGHRPSGLGVRHLQFEGEGLIDRDSVEEQPGPPPRPSVPWLRVPPSPSASSPCPFGRGASNCASSSEPPVSQLRCSMALLPQPVNPRFRPGNRRRARQLSPENGLVAPLPCRLSQAGPRNSRRENRSWRAGGQKAHEIFAEFRHHPLLPANEAYQDPVRADLDRAVLVRLLGLSDGIEDSLRLLRNQWCAEPSVHGGKDTRIRV